MTTHLGLLNLTPIIAPLPDGALVLESQSMRTNLVQVSSVGAGGARGGCRGDRGSLPPPPSRRVAFCLCTLPFPRISGEAGERSLLVDLGRERSVDTFGFTGDGTRLCVASVEESPTLMVAGALSLRP